MVKGTTRSELILAILSSNVVHSSTSKFKNPHKVKSKYPSIISAKTAFQKSSVYQLLILFLSHGMLHFFSKNVAIGDTISWVIRLIIPIMKNPRFRIIVYPPMPISSKLGLAGSVCDMLGNSSKRYGPGSTISNPDNPNSWPSNYNTLAGIFRAASP